MKVRSGSKVLDARWASMGVSPEKRQRPPGSTQADRSFSFGHFRLIPARQLLLWVGAPVRIGSRALAILAALVERRGELVTKDELVAVAWPRLFVHESNLKVNIANLRRCLGDTQRQPIYVATVYGRGYQFVASVAIEYLPSPRRVNEWKRAQRPELLPASAIVGGDEDIATLVAELRKRQFTCFYQYAAGSAPEPDLPGLTKRNDGR